MPVAEGSFANERLRRDRGPFGFLPVLLSKPSFSAPSKAGAFQPVKVWRG